MKILSAFDFDRTITEENTDSVVQIIKDSGPLPEDVKAVAKRDGWNAFMSKVFEHLHSKGIVEEDFKAVLDAMLLVDGMKECLEGLKKEFGAEIVIVSDSNSFFIDHLLKRHGLSDVVDAIYTNPAAFDRDGRLLLEPFHNNVDCDLSASNMCKGRIMREHVDKRGVQFDLVTFAGDGANDFCAMKNLKGGRDLALPRKGDDFDKFGIYKEIQRRAKEGHEIKAEMSWWANGHECFNAIKTHIENA